MTSDERREGRYQRRKKKRYKNKRKAYRLYGQYDQVFTFKNLYKAYQQSKKGVMWKASTQKYKANALLHVHEDFESLSKQQYKSKGFYEFDICERGKPRHIKSVHISERVVQKCLCNESVVPAITRSLIYDNGACITGKGIDFTLNRLNTHLHRHYRRNGHEGYVLLFDFSKYFDNISHDALIKLINKLPIDLKLKNILVYFIKQFGDKGLGLGSQISQICALLLPNPLDHMIKEELHIKGYGRYMDDGYLIHPNKKYLKMCRDKIKDKCDELGIILNLKKTQIIKLSKGFTFLKIRFYLTSSGKVIRLANKKSVVRQRRKLKIFHQKHQNGEMSLYDICCSYQSWKGHIKKARSFQLLKRMDLLYNRLFLRSISI